MQEGNIDSIKDVANRVNESCSYCVMKCILYEMDQHEYVLLRLIGQNFKS